MEYRDYYATLGIPRGATQAEIKKAYRKLARQHHPDVNKADTDAEKRFKEVSEANAVLSDPEKRKAYDSLGANWEAYQHAGAGSGRAGNPFAGFQGFNPGGGGVRFEYGGDPDDLAGFSEFFRTFFAGGASPFDGGVGGAAGARSAAGGTRTRVRTGTIEELFADMGEPGLAGNGRRRAAPPTQTPTTYEAEAEVTLEEVARGTKRHVDVGGRRIEVTIPAGVADGQKIRLTGVGPDGANVYLRVKVLPNSTFTRDGDNLSRELPLSLGEVLLGAEVPVETLTGRVLLRIPPETQNGRVFRLKGQGLPHFRGKERGDLLVRTKVVLPKGLSPEAKAAAEEFIELAGQPNPR
jgi:DnaJ-class molecular chaperone